MENNVLNPHKKDILEYADRYGYEALGYAIYDLVLNDELNVCQELAENVWEYGGNIGGVNVSIE